VLGGQRAPFAARDDLERLGLRLRVDRRFVLGAVAVALLVLVEGVGLAFALRLALITDGRRSSATQEVVR
jgi:hypothetical protein